MVTPVIILNSTAAMSVEFPLPAEAKLSFPRLALT